MDYISTDCGVDISSHGRCSTDRQTNRHNWTPYQRHGYRWRAPLTGLRLL